MILIAGIHEPDIERVKALCEGVTFPEEQRVLDEAFAKAELTIPEWALAIKTLAGEQDGPSGFGSAISAGFFSGYVTLWPDAHVVVVESDPVKAIEGYEIEGVSRWQVARHVIGGQGAIEQFLHSVPHTVIDMTTDPTDDEIRALLRAVEKAA